MFGSNSILPKEHGGRFFQLPIIAFLEVRFSHAIYVHSSTTSILVFGEITRALISPQDDVGAVCTWDSSVHDSLCLNRVTPGEQFLPCPSRALSFAISTVLRMPQKRLGEQKSIFPYLAVLFLHLVLSLSCIHEQMEGPSLMVLDHEGGGEGR